MLTATDLEVKLYPCPWNDLGVAFVSQELQDELPQMGTAASFGNLPPPETQVNV